MCRPREVLVRSMRQILGIHRRNLVGVCRLLLVREWAASRSWYRAGQAWYEGKLT